MTKDQITEYLLKNESLRYSYAKELQKTIRHSIIAVIASLTILAGLYIYFVVPVEEETFTADHGSQIVESSHIEGNNGM